MIGNTPYAYWTNIKRRLGLDPAGPSPFSLSLLPIIFIGFYLTNLFIGGRLIAYFKSKGERLCNIQITLFFVCVRMLLVWQPAVVVRLFPVTLSLLPNLSDVNA